MGGCTIDSPPKFIIYLKKVTHRHTKISTFKASNIFLSLKLHPVWVHVYLILVCGHSFDLCVYVSLCASFFTECFLYAFLHTGLWTYVTHISSWMASSYYDHFNGWSWHVNFFLIPSVLNEAPGNLCGSKVGDCFLEKYHHPGVLEFKGIKLILLIGPWILIGWKF